MEERKKEREKTENGVFDEDGKVQPWIFEAFQQFINNISPATNSQVRNGKEISKKHNENNNEVVIREERKEQQKNSSRKEKWQQKSTHEEDSQQLVRATKVTSENGSKKEKMLDILTKVANQGESILEDASFVDYCARVLCNGEESSCVTQHMNTEKNKFVPFLGKEKSNEFAGRDKIKKGTEGTSSLFCPKDKLTTDGPLDKDHVAVHEETLVSKNVAFPECTAANPVHHGSSSHKVQPTLSFAEITKKNSAHVNIDPQQPFLFHNSGNFPSSPLSSNDGSPLFKIEPDVLTRRMKLCNHSIVGRISLSKGDEPWTLKKLRDKLESIWGLRSCWRLISLGRGYYHILLLSKEEWDTVWARGPLYLKPGVLRLQRWSINFDPSKQKTTHAQVWFRIFHLPWGLWDPSIIAGIAGKVGTPLKFDKATVDGDFGHYARVLVDVDLSKSLPTNIHVECANVMIEVKMMPENIPSFCRGCNSIGHSMTDCRALIKQEVKTKSFNGVKGGEPDVQIAANSGNSSFALAGTSKPTDDIQNFSQQKDIVGMNIVEMVTDFSAQFDDHITKNTSSDCLIFSNQFSVPQSEDEVQEVVQNTEKDTNQERSTPTPSVSVLQGSKDIHTSNKFAALEEYEDMETENESNGIQGNCTDEAKCEDKVQQLPLIQGDVNQTLKGIRMWAEKERRNIMQQAEDSGQIGEKGVDENHTPKTSKRWSDIQEEEEENEAQEARSKPRFPKPTDVLSFERNGELIEIFMRNGKLRFTPISDKSKN